MIITLKDKSLCLMQHRFSPRPRIIHQSHPCILFPHSSPWIHENGGGGCRERENVSAEASDNEEIRNRSRSCIREGERERRNTKSVKYTPVITLVPHSSWDAGTEGRKRGQRVHLTRDRAFFMDSLEQLLPVNLTHETWSQQ